jgi:hypothetical protein
MPTPLAQVRPTAEMQQGKVRWGFCGASYKRVIKIKESKPPQQVRGKLLHFKKVSGCILKKCGGFFMCLKDCSLL